MAVSRLVVSTSITLVVLCGGLWTWASAPPDSEVAQRGRNTGSPAAMLKEWEGLDFSHFADYAITKACSTEAERKKGLEPALVQYAWDKYLSRVEQLRDASASSAFKLISAVLTKLSPEQKSQLGKAYYEATFGSTARGEPTGAKLILVGWTLISAGGYPQDHSFPEFARAVAAHILNGKSFDANIRELHGRVPDDETISAAMTYLNPFWYRDLAKTLDDNACPFYRSLYSDLPVTQDFAACYFFGKALGSDSDRQLLRDELTKPDCGCPRMGPAKVLTWSYKRISKLDQWREWVDTQVNNPSNQVEARQRWMLVRAYVEEAKDYAPSAWYGKPWVEKVLDSGPDEAVKQDCIEEIVNANLMVGRYNLGRKFLNEQIALGGSPSLKEFYKALLQRTSDAEASDAAHQRWQTEKEEHARLLGEIAQLQSEIKRAKAKGQSTDQIHVLQTALETLKASMQSTTQPTSDVDSSLQHS